MLDLEEKESAMSVILNVYKNARMKKQYHKTMQCFTPSQNYIFPYRIYLELYLNWHMFLMGEKNYVLEESRK